MKAATFILKRVYLERNQQRELENHLKKLDEIKNYNGNVKGKVK